MALRVMTSNRTSRVELAASRKMQRIGNTAADDIQTFFLFAQLRQRFQETAGVGMQWFGKQLLGRSLFRHAGGIHHDDLVGILSHNAQVMSDHHNAHALLPLEVAQQFQYLCLDRYIQRRRRLISDQQFRPAAQRHGDHHTLTHPAAHLVRVFANAPLGVGDPDLTHHLDCNFQSLMTAFLLVQFNDLNNLIANGKNRIETGHRFLKDHGDIIAANMPYPVFRGMEQRFTVK